MYDNPISIAFQTDKPLSHYVPLAYAAEQAGFDGISVYNDMLYQPAWLPLLEIARHTSKAQIGVAAANMSGLLYNISKVPMPPIESPLT